MAMLMTNCHLNFAEIANTPPRLISYLLRYISRSGAAAPKPKQSVLDQPMTPEQLQAFMGRPR